MHCISALANSLYKVNYQGPAYTLSVALLNHPLSFGQDRYRAWSGESPTVWSINDHASTTDASPQSFANA